MCVTCNKDEERTLNYTTCVSRVISAHPFLADGNIYGEVVFDDVDDGDDSMLVTDKIPFRSYSARFHVELTMARLSWRHQRRLVGRAGGEILPDEPEIEPEDPNKVSVGR